MIDRWVKFDPSMEITDEVSNYQTNEIDDKKKNKLMIII